MKLEHFLTAYTKINSKWIKDLHVRPETIKLLGENIGSTLDDINHSKVLYDPPPRVIEIKTTVNKWDLINLKAFSLQKKLVYSEASQLCPTLCNPVDCSLQGFSIHRILQARIQEWVTISFSRGSSRPRDRTRVSCIGGRLFNL